MNYNLINVDSINTDKEEYLLNQKKKEALELLSKVVWADDEYIVEYASEYGFLR